jgi:acetyl esterase
MTPASYRAPAIPESLRRTMAEVGPRWNADIPAHMRLMIEGFSAVLAESPDDGVAVVRDLQYGEHARQVVDVYLAPGATRAPVVLFVHGGAFVDGAKDRSPQVYGNVLRYFARHGVHGVNVEYRLAPEAGYPEGSHDVARAVAWTRASAERFGWNREQIFLFGHSAGATHAALYAYDRRLWPADGHGVAGLITVSGRMRADNLAENPNARKVEAYFGADPGTLADGSPVNHVSATSVPTLVAVAEFENTLLDVYGMELAARLATIKRRAPPFVWLRGHNHASIVAHFNTAEDDLGRSIRAFILDRTAASRVSHLHANALG